MKRLDNISDLDITTGDRSVHNLATEFSIELKKRYSVEYKKMDDGHASIFVGNMKIDFSSNFIVPRIDEVLFHKGIKNPTDMQREMFSRDFTCNSLLLTLDLKKIKDPTKQGINDINKKILKTCLDPDLTLRFNTNRIIRIVYLASKLGFTVDDEIVKWVLGHKDFVRLSSDDYLKKNLNKAMAKDADRTVYLINKMDLWDVIPITEDLYPYYTKKAVSVKSAQFRRNFDYGEGPFDNLDEKVKKKTKKKIKKNVKKKAYNEQNENAWIPEYKPYFHEDPYPFNQYFPPGIIVDPDYVNPNKYEDVQRDGKEFKEFEEFKKKNIIKKIKKLRRLRKLRDLKRDKDNIALQPAPFYSSLYGYTGFEGAYTSPLEYYSGGISVEPGAITNNPYNNVYQAASAETPPIKK